MEMAEKVRRTSFQQVSSGKTNRCGWFFRWVAYISKDSRKSGGQNRQKQRQDLPRSASHPIRPPLGKRTCPKDVLQSEVDNLFLADWQAGGQGGEKRTEERAKSRRFLAVGCSGSNGGNGRLSHNKCCVFQRNCDFFTGTDRICKGEKWGLRVKKQLTSTLYSAMMIPFKQQKSTRERSR